MSMVNNIDNKVNRDLEEVSMPIEEAARWVMRNLIPFTLVSLIPYFIIFGFGGFGEIKIYGLLIFIVSILLGVVVHELLHALVFAMFSKNGFRNVSFGIEPKTRSPWCHCNGEMYVLVYRIGALAPFFVIGLFPLVYGWIHQSIGWLLFGYIFCVGGGGDWVSFFLTRDLNWNDKIKDHPSKLGFFVVKKSGD